MCLRIPRRWSAHVSRKSIAGCRERSDRSWQFASMLFHHACAGAEIDFGAVVASTLRTDKITLEGKRSQARIGAGVPAAFRVADVEGKVIVPAGRAHCITNVLITRTLLAAAF